MDMVEKVARAILQHRHPMTRPEDMWLDPVAIREARVAIEAMKDPTFDMLVAGREANAGPRSSLHGYIYEAMVSAALEESNELA